MYARNRWSRFVGLYLNFSDLGAWRLCRLKDRWVGHPLSLGCILECRTLHRLCEGCGFFFPPEHPAHEERTQWHRLQSVGFRSSQVGRTSQDQSETHRLKSMLPASGKGRIEDRKTRTLAHRKGEPPVSSKTAQRLGRLAEARTANAPRYPADSAVAAIRPRGVRIASATATMARAGMSPNRCPRSMGEFKA